MLVLWLALVPALAERGLRAPLLLNARSAASAGVLCECAMVTVGMPPWRTA